MLRKKSLFLLLLILVLCFSLTAASAETATVRGGYLRLRRGPSTTAFILDRYPSGTVVNVLGTAGDWLYVQTSDGNQGYMLSSYLDVGASATSTSVASVSSGTAYITSSNGKSVNLRSRTSTKSTSVKLYPVGTKVTVLGTYGTWKKVSVDGKTGYIMTKYLSNTKVSAQSTASSPSSIAARVRSENGKAVHMRSGPSKKNEVIGTFEVGTQVTVLKKGTVWCYCSINGQVGYIMTAYLRF